MARIYQAGFELPGTPPNAAVFNGTGARPSWLTTNFSNSGTPGLGISPFTSNVGSTAVGIIKLDSHSHKSVAGLGGSSFLRLNGGASPAYYATFAFPYAVNDGYISFATRGPSTSSSFKISLLSSTGTGVGGGFIHAGGTLSALSSADAVLASSPSPVSLSLDSTVWHWVTIEFKSGVGTKIYINTVGSTQVMEYSGLSSSIGGIRFTTHSGTEWVIDDLVVHTPSVSFISCSSIASAPTGTITGSSSGATATIGRVEFSDSTYGTANAGRVIVYGVSGQFTDGEEITSTDGWTATVKFAGGSESGLDFNSGRPGQTYMIGLALNGDRAGSIEMTGSDGNQVDNYLLLNKSVTNDSTYVQALGVSTALDLYDLENITQNITGITGISYTSRVKKAGDINTVIPAIKVGDTVQYSPSTIDITGNLSYAQKYRVIDVNSSTNEAFTKSQIDGAAVGLRFK